MRNYQQENFELQYQEENKRWVAEQEFEAFVTSLQNMTPQESRRIAMVLLAAQDFIQFGTDRKKQYLDEALQDWDSDVSFIMPEVYRVV